MNVVDIQSFLAAIQNRIRCNHYTEYVIHQITCLQISFCYFCCFNLDFFFLVKLGHLCIGYFILGMHVIYEWYHFCRQGSQLNDQRYHPKFRNEVICLSLPEITRIWITQFQNFISEKYEKKKEWGMISYFSSILKNRFKENVSKGGCPRPQPSISSPPFLNSPVLIVMSSGMNVCEAVQTIHLLGKDIHGSANTILA